MNTYRHLLKIARQYDPLSTDYFRIVCAVNSYNNYVQRWYDDPAARRQVEPLITQTRQWCEAIQYAIINGTAIPALRDIEQPREAASPV
ncbi:MAG: hypothetical protein CL610_12660 [Anaerolineaceae bacterium]|nr:hypothetical protein [Anaerolineaceae bacterium]